MVHSILICSFFSGAQPTGPGPKAAKGMRGPAAFAGPAGTHRLLGRGHAGVISHSGILVWGAIYEQAVVKSVAG